MSRLRAVPALFLAIACAQGLPHGAAAADLPVPCAGGACGVDAIARQFVQSGTAAITATTANAMTVTAGDKAILNWQSFDVGAGHSIQFVQPSATAAVLNRIWGADGSTIAGALQANGQVYLVNQNGIVFAEGARVDTAGLVASSLNVTDELFRNGILSGNAAFTGVGLPAVFDAGSGAAGPVSVERGAVLTTSTGGRVMLFASTVRNDGTISTPDGQTILGAGRTVYLAASTDPAMRGLLIQVNGNGNAAASTVTNAGVITAERGNVTLAGLMVNQAGKVRATTSVAANGTVYLVAGDTSRPNPDSGTGAPLQFYDQSRPGFGQLLPNRGGTLTLASGSATTVLPDTTDRATINDGQSFLRSAVHLVGETVVLRGTAEIRAPAGSVTLSAAANPIERQLNPSLGLGAPANASRIFLDAESVIDVAGLRDVEVSASRNLIKVELRANELQDTPLLRSSVLRGRPVVVDIRQGTTLADITPYRNNIQRGIAEKSIAGGTISLLSEGDVVARAGSRLDVSGGSIAYTPGLGSTTQLLGVDGKTYDIATAPKEVGYTGFADPGSIGAGRSIAGYREGASAGAITVVAPQVALRSALAGHAVVGLYQRSAALLPSGGRFVLGDAAAGDTADPVKDFRTGAIRLVRSVDDLPTDFDPLTSTLPAADRATALVSTRALGDGGFDRVALYGNGTISAPADTTLVLGSHGSLVLSGAAIALDGAIDVRGGTVDLRARGDTFGGLAGDGGIALGSGARITTTGEWVNDSPRVTLATGIEPDVTARAAIDGGAVTLRAFRGVALAAGSRIDASGGGWIDRSGNLQSGVGGDITIAANSGADPTQISGGILLDGALRSIAFARGGRLTLDSASVTIGGSATSAVGELHLDADFFSRGGFSGFHVIGQNALVVAPGTTLQPRMLNLVADAPAIDRPTGSDIAGFTDDRLLTLAQGRAPVDLHFATRSTGLFTPGAGDLEVGAGASIAVDPGGSVILEARENLTVLGSITAPGGRIALRTASGVIVGSDDINEGYVAGQRLLVGGNARLSAGAVSKITTETNALGLRKGRVLDGGVIEIAATKGTVILEAGSVVDVSGVTDVVDLEVAGLGGGVRPTVVAGAAGSIEIRAREGWTLAGALSGRAAALAGAAAGHLTLGFDLYDRTQDPNAQILPGSLVPRFDTRDRLLTLTAGGAGTGVPAVGTARVSVDTIAAGGFDAVTLRSTDVIRLDGTLRLDVRSRLSLEAPLVEATPGTDARFAAAIVAIGNPDGRNQPGTGTGRFPQPLRDPATGNARLGVAADLIDLAGNTTLGGFGSVVLASTGDIRLHHAAQSNGATDFTGSLKTAADLTLHAAQVYPTTRTTYTINPDSGGYRPGAVTISGGGSTTVPLSAGGALTVRGTDIVQAGTLRAPFGSLSLIATRSLDVRTGSLTSVSGSGRVIPYGSTQNGTDWIYRIDTTGTSAIVAAPPEKRIDLDAPSVHLAAGAVVDLSGGGDLYAYEFIAGPGGSRDVLDGTGRYTAAIVPDLGSRFAPLDHQYGLTSDIAPGAGVYLKGVPGVPDGFHPLLPARYALLPGAFAVHLTTDRTDLAFGTTLPNLDGSITTAVLPGQSGTDILGSRTLAMVLVSGAALRTQSQFVESTADAFFSGTAGPRLPLDAGRLELGATASLDLNAIIHLAGTETLAGGDGPPSRRGRGGEVSLRSPRIAVVDTVGAPDGFLQITASRLESLRAERLVLGARATDTAAGTVLDVRSAVVEFRHGAATPLVAQEILVAAQDRITVGAGSRIVAQGTPGTDASGIRVAGDGALLRVSSGAQATLVRTDVPAGAHGGLDVGPGASLEGRSVLLDATSETVFAGDASIAARAVSVASSRVSLGDVPDGTGGLRITSALLSAFDGLQDLSIRSYGSVDLFGAASLGGRTADGAPTLDRVVIDAAAIVGHGSESKVVTAREIVLSNVSGATCAACAGDGAGAGALRLEAGGAAVAGRIALGAGAKRISGFSATTFDATGDIRAVGDGSLALTDAGDLHLRSVRVDGATGTDQRIVNDTGAVRLSRHPGALDPGSAGIGARLAITGTAIRHDGTIELPSGLLDLRAATGDISFGPGAIARANGIATTLGGQPVYAAGGRILLAADAGNVVLAPGSTVDVSGARNTDGTVGGDAGALTVRVPAGTFTSDGTLLGDAAGAARQGDFALDARTIADLGGLGAALAADGFAGDLHLRARSGDVALNAGATLRGASLRLAADGGTITVAGTIDTRGTQGGAIALWSRDNLAIAGGALLDSRGTAGRGGAVTLGTSDGTIAVAAGFTIDLRGIAAPDGILLLRAPRTAGNDDVRVAALDGTVRTSNDVVVEGVRVYAVDNTSGAATLGGTGTLAAGNLAFATATTTLRTETRAFANAGASIAARLAGSGFDVRVRPGIEVRTDGALTLTSTLDFRSGTTAAPNWRVDGVPVNLTMRAAGDLTLAAPLTDGFQSVTGRPVTQWTLAAGDSASYRLAAGADLASADPLAVVREGGGHFTLQPGQLIRTGNGTIEIAASRDVRIGYDVATDSYTRTGAQAAVVYTAGVPGDPLAEFPTPVIATRFNTIANYPTGGGDISVRAGDDVHGAPTNQLSSDWLWRRGAVRPDGTIATTGVGAATRPQNTTWWIAFDRFQQGFGALGGGDIRVDAGRDVVNVSAVVPTNGRLPGAAGTLPDADRLVVQGGGDLDVVAGRDIRSGLFLVDRGAGRLSAGGEIASGRVVADTNPASGDARAVYPILVLGDASIAVQSRGDVTIDGAISTATIPMARDNKSALASSYFYTFRDDTRVAIASVAGDVRLRNDVSVIRATTLTDQLEPSDNEANFAVYPPNLSVTAAAGSIELGGLRLFPSATGDLRVLAAQDVRLLGAVQMHESDVARVASPLRPVTTLAGIGIAALPGRSPEIYLDTVRLPSTPLHAADTKPVRIAARDGSIFGNSQPVELPKSAVLTAGQDIADVRLSAKNFGEDADTRFEAGRDIVFAVAKTPSTNQLATNNDGIRVGGLGSITVLAGRDIDLGNSRGIVSRGNLDDVRLPGRGATIDAFAGLGSHADGTLRRPDEAAFAAAYLAPLFASGNPGGYGTLGAAAPFLPTAREDLSRFMLRRAGVGSLEDTTGLAAFLGTDTATVAQLQRQEGRVELRDRVFTAAYAAFEAMPRQRQVSWAFFEQIRLSNQEAAVERLLPSQFQNADRLEQIRGLTAISTLFPFVETDPEPDRATGGDVNLFFSQIKTEQGGDLHLFTPGGRVVVGLPNPPAELADLKRDTTVTPALPAAANLGLLALAEGGIRVYAKGDISVNQARILTLQGGDILLWTSVGDIDAGRGAKTASAAPPPVIQTDANGNVFVNPSGAVSGSGIGQLLTRSGIRPGVVDLIALRGELDANDGGVIVAGDLTITALTVNNAENIAAGGTTTGVAAAGPSASAVASGNGVADNSAGVAKDVPRTNAAETPIPKDTFKPSFLTVRLFCLGAECGVGLPR